jgi:hypothetical protein
VSALAAARRGPAATAAVLLGCLALLPLAVITGVGAHMLPPAVLIVVVMACGHRVLLRWRALLTAIVLVVFFIPIKRYSLPSALPFNLEPYRLAIALVALAWVTSLLLDPALRLRRSGLERPLGAFLAVALASVLVNAPHLASTGLMPYVVKSLTFFVSFLLVFFITTSVLRTRADVERVLKVMVASGAIVAIAALVEYRTHDNLFNHLSQLVPALHFDDPRITAGLDPAYLQRSGQLRTYASAAHPIELSAVLAILVDPALYLLRRTGRRRWGLAALLLVVGVLTTLSRTGIIMLLAVGAVHLWLRPRETRRRAVVLVPAVVVVFAAVPHTLGAIYGQFFPSGGLVAQQSQVGGRGQNALVTDGRLADIGPALAEWSHHPLIGEGFGSRITASAEANRYHVPLARILDDQWLSSLLEVGALGVAALGWLLVRAGRRLLRVAREDRGDDGALALALFAPLVGLAVGMLTFDALSFVQLTIVFFLLLALGATFLRLREENGAGPETRPSGRP